VSLINYHKIETLAYVIPLLLFLVSLFFGLGLQFILFLVLFFFVSFIFMFFCIYNHKLYLLTLTLILIISGALICLWNQSYSLNSIIYYVFPIWGILAAAAKVSFQIKNLNLLVETKFLIGSGQFEKAIEKIDKVLESDGEHKLAVCFKALALNNIWKPYEALKLINKTIEEESDKTTKIDALNLKFSILLNLRRYNEVEKFIDVILEKYPNNLTTLLNGALLLYKLGFREDATEVYEDLLNPANERILKFRKSIVNKIRLPKKLWNWELNVRLMEKSAIHYQLHQYNEALECFNEILELNPEDIDALDIKGFSLAKLRYYNEALKCSDKSLELYSKNARALYLKGYVFTHSSEPENALKCFQKALEIYPLYEEVYYSKGKTHQELKQYNEALECFEKVLELNPYCKQANNLKEEIEEVIG